MKNILFTLALLFTVAAFSQNSDPKIFERISAEMKNFKIDTTAVPDDKFSKKIAELRSLRGGFNIAEAMEYKIAEERNKENADTASLDKMAAFFKTGNGKKWLDNAVVHIYRNHFTYREIKQLVKFYKTEAGQKMANSFPFIMVESVKAADEIGAMLANHKP